MHRGFQERHWMGRDRAAMKYLVPCILLLALLAGLGSCKKNPVAPKPDSTKCDTCNIDTNHHPCDTCGHDTTHHTVGPNDTTSHNFAWTQYSLASEAGLSGCWVFGPKDIYVVGGSVWKYDGVMWRDVSPLSSRGYSLKGKLSSFTLFAFTENDYWLTNGNILFHYDGSEAQDIRTDSLSGSATLHSSWGTSSINMYSVGDGGTILHFDGTTWTRMASGTTTRLSSIWGTGDDNVWACGYDQTTGKTTLLHYDDSIWKEDALSVAKGIDAVGGFNPVWTCDSAGHKIAVTTGAIVVKKTDERGWRSDSGRTPNTLSSGGYVGLYALSGNSANDYVAAGGWGWVGHWNGKSWMRYDVLYNYGLNDYFSGAISMKGNTVCVAGEKNGAGWVAIGQR